MTREELLRGLRTRFLLGERRRREPAIADEVIEAPVVVTGPARSGTTILFELLGLDPGLRTPVATDVLHPVLPPGTGEDERRAMTEAEQELWADVQPEFAAIHELRSDLPVECITICAPSFAGSHWPMVLTDHGSAGRPTWPPTSRSTVPCSRRCSTGGRRRRWLLKTPGYLLMLDDLLAAYPDACVILTHRDPARTMPSTVSTTAMVQWLRTDRVDLDGLAALIGAVFTDALTAIARRRADGSLPGVYGDVRFADLMADPGRRHRRRLRGRSAASWPPATARAIDRLPGGQAPGQARHAPLHGRGLGLRRRRAARRPGRVHGGLRCPPSSRSDLAGSAQPAAAAVRPASRPAPPRRPGVAIGRPRAA